MFLISNLLLDNDQLLDSPCYCPFHNKNPRKWHIHTTYKGSHSYLYSPNFDKFLLIHLCSNLCRKIFLLLFNTFTGLKTHEFPDAYGSTILFCNLSQVLRYGLLSVLSLYIYLF